VTRRPLAPLAAGALLGLAACGGGADRGGGATTTTPARTVTVEKVTTPPAGAPVRAARFDPQAIYRRESPGVVTVISIYTGGTLSGALGGDDNGSGLGSGFVIGADGEIATNAHVVTNGQGARLRRARNVYVQFADGNQVPARIVGADPNVDVALIRVNPAGLTLRPLPLGTTRGLSVGAPVAAIGSPFGEPQSLSVGVVSGLHRSIDSLAGQFAITGAIQTDAAINHGNSGGPLVDAGGHVIGINSQIESTGGGGEGVGFAVPVDSVKRSLSQLRRKGTASYAYLGVSTVPVYPQLARRFGLAVKHGAWVQDVTAGSPAARAGLRPGSGEQRFQTATYKPGGDVIVSVDGRPLRRDADLSLAIASRAPGDRVRLEVRRGTRRRTLEVTLTARPVGAARGG
jgi:S1-C subfamily serine protease